MEKLLFTGGTGFLGNNIRPSLEKMYEVTTIGITPQDMLKANFVTDIPSLPQKYDVVLHAAGKAHIRPKTEAEKKAFYDVNYTGTRNLCKALEQVGCPKSFVFISTMSVYGESAGNDDTEERQLIGDSPYSESKIMAELFLRDWADRNDVILGILRPSLIAGRGAPGNLGAMINGIRSGRYFSIAHGKARKSILMAEDIARLVPLIEKKGGTYNVCDSHNPSFGELETIIAKQLGKRPPISIPVWLAKCAAWVGDLIGDSFPLNSARLKKIITSDTFSNQKARKELGWEPLDVIHNFRV